MKTAIPISLMIALVVAPITYADWTTLVMSGQLDLNVPEKTATVATGKDSSNDIVGTYLESGDYHGFSYDGADYTYPLDFPDSSETYICGLDDTRYVGYFTDSSGTHGFVYDSDETSPWISYDFPGASTTVIVYIGGDVFAGYYNDSSGYHGFIYDGTDEETFDVPGAVQTFLCDIDGDNIVGHYTDSGGTHHGFIYDLSVDELSVFDPPGSAKTYISGIEGPNLVGEFEDSSGRHGFFYDGTNGVIINAPGAIATSVMKIQGCELFGTYSVTGSAGSGFVYQIPEPATLSLLVLGGSAVIRWGREFS